MANNSSNGSVSYGTIGSLFIILVSVSLALLMQYYGAADVKLSSWNVDCSNHGDDYKVKCKGDAAVLRISMVSFIFFSVTGAICSKNSSFHNKYWFPKIGVFAALLIISIFIPNYVFDDHGYVWFARIGSFVFIILQQIILINLAYNINEKLVEKSTQINEGFNKYLLYLILLSILLYSISITVIAILFKYFSGCPSNDTFISLTLILCLIFTILQVFISEHGNLLTSSVVTSYAVFLCYCAVSNNPKQSCNPMISDSRNAYSICIGLGITILSIVWTSYSASTSVNSVLTKSSSANETNKTNSKPSDLNKILIGETSPTAVDNISTNNDVESNDKNKTSQNLSSSASDEYDNGYSMQFNLTMALISMYYAMVLTNWATLQSHSSNINSPQSGKIAMWMEISAEYVAVVLYIWALIAPKLFPDRDFS